MASRITGNVPLPDGEWTLVADIDVYSESLT